MPVLFGFKCCNLHLRTLRSWPWAKLKATTAQACSEWLYHLHLQQELFRSPYGKTRTCMLWGFVGIYRLFSKPNKFRFDDAEVLELSELRRAALFGFSELTRCAFRNSRALYKVTPKLHIIDKMFRRAISGRRNPATYSCFSDEDFCGKVTKLSNTCHHASVCRRCPERWMLVYFAEFESAIK